MKYDDPQESVIGVVSLIEQEVNSFLNINSLCAPDSIGRLYFFVAPYCGWPIIPIFSVISYLIPRDENNEIFLRMYWFMYPMRMNWSPSSFRILIW